MKSLDVMPLTNIVTVTLLWCLYSKHQLCFISWCFFPLWSFNKHVKCLHVNLFFSWQNESSLPLMWNLKRQWTHFRFVQRGQNKSRASLLATLTMTMTSYQNRMTAVGFNKTAPHRSKPEGMSRYLHMYILHVCIFVSVLSLVYVFSHPLSVSLSGHLCVFPLHGNLPATPPYYTIWSRITPI